MCDLFGVSRTVVREVLRHLEAEGLVETLPQQRPAVVRPNVGQAAQIYEIRALLEAEAARGGCYGGYRGRSRTLAGRQRLYPGGFCSGIVARRVEGYHELLRDPVLGRGQACRLGGGAVSYARINHLRGMTIATPGRRSQVDAEMRRIIEAVAVGDGEAAARASFDHVRTVAALAATVLSMKKP